MHSKDGIVVRRVRPQGVKDNLKKEKYMGQKGERNHFFAHQKKNGFKKLG